jgi:hypothetical protein
VITVACDRDEPRGAESSQRAGSSAGQRATWLKAATRDPQCSPGRLRIQGTVAQTEQPVASLDVLARANSVTVVVTLPTPLDP